MKHGKLYVIPDENKILEECFKREVIKEHLSALQEFSDKYSLGYSFMSDDYQQAPCMLALDGNLIVKTEEETSLAVCYLPEIVTDRQAMWLSTNENLLSNYSMVGGYKVDKENDSPSFGKMHGIDEIIKESNRRNLYYNRGKEDSNVGKKI